MIQYDSGRVFNNKMWTWIDMRSSTNNTLQGSGRALEKSGMFFKLKNQFKCLQWSHLNLRYCVRFEQRVPWHLGNFRVQNHSKMRM